MQSTDSLESLCAELFRTASLGSTQCGKALSTAQFPRIKNHSGKAIFHASPCVNPTQSSLKYEASRFFNVSITNFIFLCSLLRLMQHVIWHVHTDKETLELDIVANQLIRIGCSFGEEYNSEYFEGGEGIKSGYRHKRGLAQGLGWDWDGIKPAGYG